MRRVLTRAAAMAVLVPSLLVGCTVVADLGDPKQLADGGSGSSSGGSTIGDAAIDEDATGPTLAPVAIAVASTHACAVLRGPSGQPGGVVRCWGSNTDGELGADPRSTMESALPLEVPSLTDVGSLALSTGYSCATTTAQSLYCWGAVAAEDPSGVHRAQPAPAYQPSYVEVGTNPLSGVQAASVGPVGGAVLTSDALVCWGSAIYREHDAGSDAGDAGVTLGLFYEGAVGRAHACAITQDMTDVECWGDNSRGQCGVPPQDGMFMAYPTYVGLSSIPNVGTITGIAAGADFTCAMTSSDAVYCWGANDAGQLGNPSVTGDQSTPTQVLLTGFTPHELALGDKHGCVQTAGFSVHCWGDDSAGQLGIPPGGALFVAAPGNVYVDDKGTKLENVVHVAAGGDTTCATRETDDYVWCWGANDSGQTGQPTSNAVVRYATPLSL